MIAVIFEVSAVPGISRRPYLDLAAESASAPRRYRRLHLGRAFQSLTEPGKLLLLSIWRDEATLQAWRRLGEHRVAQAMGRNRMFKDYRLRVVEVQRDYGKYERAQAPGDSREAHGG